MEKRDLEVGDEVRLIPNTNSLECLLWSLNLSHGAVWVI